ncbi:hypothetical protein FRC19_003703 [Serendipita sp. 401]|nr:hypothetical protein FRC15_004885 [Serendipita sp. 397]KAG8823490.1 hypothetical protein FRC19_003703 [Serendipita sp. 401]KAG9056292.1 hypothetical protein FS842_011084 [Serendipita sp. 407]
MKLRIVAALAALLSTLATVNASVVNGKCTGSGGAPGVCISTSSCTAGGGKYITGACPGTPADIKCCTKTSCGGGGGNCRWTDQCGAKHHTVSGLCPGPNGFKCCVPDPIVCGRDAEGNEKRCIP